MNKQDYSIGVLSLTAILMFVGITIVSTAKVPTAEANSGMSQAGQYTLFIGQAGVGFSHAYVLDSATDQLLTYRLRQGTRKIDLTSKILLGDQGKDDKKKNRRP